MLAVSVAAIGRAEMQTRMSARLEATNVASETHILLKLLTQHSTLRQLVTRLGRLPANSLCFTLALHIRGRRLASLNLSRSRCRSDGERRCRCFKGRDGLSARRVSEEVCIACFLEFEVRCGGVQVGDDILLLVCILYVGYQLLSYRYGERRTEVDKSSL
jgi:hypothetical protein